VVEAERFVLRGRDGRERLVLGTTHAGDPFVALLGENGEPRAALHLKDDSPHLHLHDRAGTLRVSVALDDADSGPGRSGEVPSVSLCNSDGTAQVQLVVLPQGGGPCVGLNDDGGRQRVFLTLLDDTYLVVTDARNRKVRTVPKPGRKK
jgi:hypothetical protein